MVKIETVMAKKRNDGFRNTNRLKRVNELTGGYEK